MVVWNVDAMATGQQAFIGIATTSTSFTHVAARDASAAGAAGSATVFALENTGYLDYTDDIVHAYSASTTALTESTTTSVRDDTRDLQVMDVTGDGTASVLVLSKGNFVETFAADATGALTLQYDATLGASGDTTRIASADVTGKSAAGTLVAGPTTIAGRTVPIGVLTFAPFVAGVSDGVSQTILGSSQSSAQATTSTVSLQASMTLSAEEGIPDVADVEIGTKLATANATTSMVTSQVTIQSTFTVNALGGTNDASVILANACFHAYTYQIDDPENVLGGDGKKTVVSVPVSGTTVAWSLARYTKLASALGNLPLFTVPYDDSDPTTYPGSPVKLDGSAIAPADAIVAQAPSFSVSDDARVGWQYTLTSQDTQGVMLTRSISALGSGDVAGVSVGAEVGVSRATGYSVTVGQSAIFGGSIPPFKATSGGADPLSHRDYSFSPVVYDESDATTDTSYVVLTYTVAP